MFAVVKTGGKQYRVSKGDVITVEKIEGEAGTKVELSEILMAGKGEKVDVGRPLLEGKSVTAKIVEQGKGPKLTILKFRRRKDSRTKNGHRQKLTQLEIVSIN